MNPNQARSVALFHDTGSLARFSPTGSISHPVALQVAVPEESRRTAVLIRERVVCLGSFIRISRLDGDVPRGHGIGNSVGRDLPVISCKNAGLRECDHTICWRV